MHRSTWSRPPSPRRRLLPFRVSRTQLREHQTRIDPSAAATAVLDRARAILAGEKSNAGVPTGLPDLDMRTGGLRPGELWVLGGRPGQGKTILGTGFARKVAEHGARLIANGEVGVGALLFSLELPEEQVVARLLADIAYRPRNPITFGQIMRGELQEQDLDRLEDARAHLERLPLAIDVAPGLSVAEIASRVRAEKNRMPKRNIRLAVVVIDYLKFVRATDRYRGMRVYEIGEITGALKQLAKAENICVVLLVQANRAVEAKDRRDKRPGMADLRDSGDIEADADVVAFIYRESVYLKQTPGVRPRRDRSVARLHRGGVQGRDHRRQVPQRTDRDNEHLDRRGRVHVRFTGAGRLPVNDLPAPLVEADVDCTDLDGFYLNVERLMSSELLALHGNEIIGAAVLLWCRAWKQRPAASLPDDDRINAAFARLPLKKFREVKDAVMRGFVKCSDGRLYHVFLSKVATDAYRRKVAFRKEARGRRRTPSAMEGVAEGNSGCRARYTRRNAE